MRYVKDRLPEVKGTSWQKAGWTREPRNGYEWRRLREGKPQPQERDRRFRRAYKCRRCGPGHPFKVVYLDGRAQRICCKCDTAKKRRYYEAHKVAQLKSRDRYKQELRKMEIKFTDGIATVPATWLHSGPSKIIEHVGKGIIVVEIFGEPAYAIVSLEQARKLR